MTILENLPMILKRFLLAIILSLILIQHSSVINAQQTQNKNELLTKFSPLNLLNPNMPHLTLGLEYKLKKHISFEFAYGRRIMDQGVLPYLNYHLSGKKENLSYFDSIVTPSFGERIHFEFKYYIQKNGDYEAYIGLAYYRILDTRNMRITYFKPDPTDPNASTGAYEHTAIKKRIQIIDLMVGGIVKFEKLYLEPYFMLGLKHKNQKYIKNEFEALGYTSYRHFIWDQPMNAFRPSINIGFRISYPIF